MENGNNRNDPGEGMALVAGAFLGAATTAFLVSNHVEGWVFWLFPAAGYVLGLIGAAARQPLVESCLTIGILTALLALGFLLNRDSIVMRYVFAIGIAFAAGFVGRILAFAFAELFSGRPDPGR
jgi:hypothetical protein